MTDPTPCIEGEGGPGSESDRGVRHGYWAPNHAIEPAEQAKEEVQDAVFSREEMLDIPLKVHTEFFKQSDFKAQLTVETRVDLKVLKFKKADDRNRDTLVVVTGVFDENGRYVKARERTMQMQLRDQTWSPREPPGCWQKVSFDPLTGRYVVRVVVEIFGRPSRWPRKMKAWRSRGRPACRRVALALMAAAVAGGQSKRPNSEIVHARGSADFR